ncbi:hypothetical protein PF007_g20680 [Phytophthora fragariae]|nr:hypothetical protein PF007_g20680 [Phytophthora fragariae]
MIETLPRIRFGNSRDEACTFEIHVVTILDQTSRRKRNIELHPLDEEGLKRVFEGGEDDSIQYSSSTDVVDLALD